MTTKRLVILLVASLALLTALFLALRENLPVNILGPEEKTWEITFFYDTQNQTLSLKKITALEKQIRPDFRGAANSPYKLSVLDKSSKVLYLTKIHITESLSHSIWTGYPEASASPFPAAPTVLETTVFIPYFENGSKIQIERDGKITLTFDVKQKSGYLWIPKVFAQTSTSTGGPITVVILSDYFTSLSQFQQQAQTVISAFQGVAPYNTVNPPIFNFVVADFIQSRGCFINPFNVFPAPVPRSQCDESALRSDANRASPGRVSKIIMLSNNNLSQAPPLGLTNDIGGDISLIGVNQPPGISFTQLAIHEFLGHAVGELYDRYTLTSKPGIKRGIKSNCSDNSSGEAFWRTAGAGGPYGSPCDSPGLYAPTPNDCPPPPPPPPGYSGPVMVSGGSRSSIMGACNSNAGFDSVEQAWIRTQIIPRYQAASAPTPTPTPISPITPVATNDCSFNLTNGQIVRGDILTQISAVKVNPSYYLSLVVLNSAVGSFVGGVTQTNSLVVSWNSSKLFQNQNGPATLRCMITSTALGGDTILFKDVTVNVQN